MRKQIYFLLLIFSFSCKKESPIEPQVITIEPGAYYPVYPGSFWKYYSYSSNIFFYSRTDSIYHLHSYKSQKVNCFQTDSVYVPYLNGNPIYGYNQPKHINSLYSSSPSECLSLVPFLKEEVGTIYSLTTDNHGGGYKYEVIDLIDTMTIRGVLYSDIILVQYRQYHWNGSTLHLTHTHYAKNVGMIRSAVLSTTYNPVMLDTIEIDSFYVNH